MDNNDFNQVKSNDRVADHGEVFTSHREVIAMLNLVKQETENIDSRFLEPACGTGNFLVEILRRKLARVEKRYAKNQIEYERYAIISLMNIYGVELLLDNTETCRNNLFELFTKHYLKFFKKSNPKFLKTAEFILKRNILCGDALSLKDEKGKPIVFSEWSRPFNDSRIKRRDFIFEEIIPNDSHDLFHEKKLSIEGLPDFNPKPIKDYSITNYLNLADGDRN